MFVLNASLPKEYDGVIGVPKKGVVEVKFNGITVWRNGNPVRNKVARMSQQQTSNHHLSFDVKGGEYKVIAVK